MRLTAAVILAASALFAVLAGSAFSADDPQKAQATFDSLFARDIEAVRATSDGRDDVDLAQHLLEAASGAADQPAFLLLICDAAYDLALARPEGYPTAVKVLTLLGQALPDRAETCRVRLLEVRQKQFEGARGEEKRTAAEVLLDLVMAEAEAREAAATLGEAAALYRRAQGVAKASHSARQGEIERRVEALTLRMRTVARVADIKAMLEKDPDNTPAREGLVRLCVVDLDDPAAAAQYLEGCKDADLLKYVPAASHPLDSVPELACLELGEWYRSLAESVPPYVRAAMCARARAYLARFLSLHDAQDLDRTRGTVALAKVREVEATAKDQMARPPRAAAAVEVILVEAEVDGRTELWLTPTGLFWRCMGVAKVGQHGQTMLPTYVNGAVWMPEWGKPQEARGHDACKPYPLPIGRTDFTLQALAIGKTRDVTGIENRDPVRVRTEGQALVISIPDEQSGARWYRLRLVRVGRVNRAAPEAPAVVSPNSTGGFGQ
jgi:hypothetical protein